MEYMARNDLGVRLRHARNLRGLTQVELAKASGVKQATISDIETGASQSPVGTNLVNLARTLQISPEWLAQGEGDMEHDGALPVEAVKHARQWMKLAPEVRASVAKMVDDMVKTSSADEKATEDEKVEHAYGKPGKSGRRSASR